MALKFFSKLSIAALIFYSVSAQSESLDKQILILANSAKQTDFASYLSLHKNINSVISHFSQNYENLSEEVLQTYFLAKQFKMQKNTIKSSEQFKKLLRSLFKNPLNQESFKILNETYLSLSQLADSEEEQKYWLTYFEASQFLAKHEDSTKNDSSFKTLLWRPFDNFSNFQEIRINSLIYSNAKDLEILLPDIPLQFVFLSNSHHPVFINITPSQLSKTVITQTPLVSGNCLSPELQNLPLEFIDRALIFYSPSCMIDVKNGVKNFLPFENFEKGQNPFNKHELLQSEFLKNEQKSNSPYFLAIALSVLTFDYLKNKNIVLRR